ncbi:MAG: hypothetical protein A2W27_05020 [Deltaproteobacteria bacterium RBG_16_44_11]|nr:MAG: hypothetical protein A2W27_05020 [Deltaproteobacteria bacterium RBG_16_44_11]
MYPKTKKEIQTAKEECEKMLTKRALASAAVSLSPIIGPDIAADMALLLDLLPRINRRFGFAPEQIDSLDEKTIVVVYQLIKATGKAIVGKYVTKELIIILLKRIGIRVTAKQVAKFVPFIGPAISSAISFAGMKYMGKTHIRECVALATELLQSENGKASLGEK